MRFLCDGFYFSYGYDLTASRQRRIQWMQKRNQDPIQLIASDSRYFWNLNLYRDFISQKVDCKWFTPLIQGYYGQAYGTIERCKVSIILISRRIHHRAGTRYNARGIDDLGYVGNQVEKEQILMIEDKFLFSHVQKSGSLPVFWEQSGFKEDVTLTRSPELTKIAFGLHFSDIIKTYGKVLCINLLQQKAKREEILTNAYVKQIYDAEPEIKDKIKYQFFDFHHYTSGNNFDSLMVLVQKVDKDAIEHGYFIENIKNRAVEKMQHGIIRTNCLDSLDRTNVAQGKIGLYVLQLQLQGLGFDLERVYGTEFTKKGIAFMFNENSRDIIQQLRAMWTDMGDYLSRQYAGTDSTISGVSRDGKETFDTKMQHKTVTVQRFFLNTLKDNPMQLSIEIVLGKFLNQGYSKEQTAYIDRQISYIAELKPKSETLTISVASWNLNDVKKAYEDVDLKPWLLPMESVYPDIFIIGFQEIEQKNAAGSKSIDKQFLKDQIQQVLTHLNKVCTEQYQLLSSTNMFGLHTLLLSKQQIHTRLEQVNTSMASKGNNGSQGAASIRFKIADTTFCFMNCSLEEGLASEFQRRRFQMLRDICNESFRQERGTIYQYFDVFEHDVQVLFGNMNFRLLPNISDFDFCDKNIQAKDFAELLKKDEFYAFREKDSLLRAFAEGAIQFAPTFKYITGTSKYDREKIPSYTDRVLWSIKQPDQADMMKQIYYNRAEINLSDRKPVCAIFEAQIKTVDHALAKIFRDQFAEKFNQFNQEKLLKTISERIDKAQPIQLDTKQGPSQYITRPTAPIQNTQQVQNQSRAPFTNPKPIIAQQVQSQPSPPIQNAQSLANRQPPVQQQVQPRPDAPNKELKQQLNQQNTGIVLQVGQSSTTSAQIENIPKQQNQEMFKCNQCSKIFISQQYLEKHQSRKHNDQATENLQKNKNEQPETKVIFESVSNIIFDKSPFSPNTVKLELFDEEQELEKDQIKTQVKSRSIIWEGGEDEDLQTIKNEKKQQVVIKSNIWESDDESEEEIVPLKKNQKRTSNISFSSSGQESDQQEVPKIEKQEASDTIFEKDEPQITSWDKIKQSRKLKVLCLHGYNTDKNVMTYQMRNIKTVFDEVMDFIIVDAPFECMEEPPKELNKFLKQDGKFRSWLQFPEGQRVPDCVYGLEEAVSFLSDCMKNEGPFDGVLAFSQGGIIYRHFYNITQYIDAKAYQDQYGNPLFQMPKFMICVATPVFLNMEFSYKDVKYPQEIKPMFNFPSVHLNGEQDNFSKQLTCHKLFEAESKPIVLTFQGGHGFPHQLEDKEFNLLKQFIRNQFIVKNSTDTGFEVSEKYNFIQQKREEIEVINLETIQQIQTLGEREINQNDQAFSSDAINNQKINQTTYVSDTESQVQLILSSGRSININDQTFAAVDMINTIIDQSLIVPETETNKNDQGFANMDEQLNLIKDQNLSESEFSIDQTLVEPENQVDFNNQTFASDIIINLQKDQVVPESEINLNDQTFAVQFIEPKYQMDQLFDHEIKDQIEKNKVQLYADNYFTSQDIQEQLTRPIESTEIESKQDQISIETLLIKNFEENNENKRVQESQKINSDEVQNEMRVQKSEEIDEAVISDQQEIIEQKEV